MTNSSKSTGEKSLTEKIRELDTKVEWFYSEEFSLDQAMDRYKEAASLSKEIEKDLDNLKNEFSIIQKDFTKS